MAGEANGMLINSFLPLLGALQSQIPSGHTTLSERSRRAHYGHEVLGVVLISHRFLIVVFIYVFSMRAFEDLDYEN
jgi:hypothetical protein